MLARCLKRRFYVAPKLPVSYAVVTTRLFSGWSYIRHAGCQQVACKTSTIIVSLQNKLSLLHTMPAANLVFGADTGDAKTLSCHCSRSDCLLGPAWPQGHPTCWLHDVAAGRSVLLVQRLLATMERLLLLHRQLRSSLPLHPRQALPRRLPVTFRLKAVSMASSQRYTPQQSHFPFYCLFNGNSRSLQHCLWLFNGTIPSAHA